MKTFLKFAALAVVAIGLGSFITAGEAQAQGLVTTGYVPAVSYYRPRPFLRPNLYAPAVTAIPTTTYYAPSAPVTSYYAPSVATTSYYAPAAPVTTYYAPSAPVTTYYAPSYTAPITTYYTPTGVTPPVVVPTW